jgi:hypothetical protein
MHLNIYIKKELFLHVLLTLLVVEGPTLAKVL